MASPERLLIAEDDPPMRLIALALGMPVDARMKTLVGRYFRDADTGLGELRAAGNDSGLAAEVVPAVANADPLETQLDGVHYVVVEGADINASLLAHAADVRLVQKHGEDCRNIDVVAAARRGIPVAIHRRWANSSVAEQTMMLMLAVVRRLLSSHAAAARPTGDVPRGESSYNWPRVEGMRSLRGLTLGLVGLGEIGRDVARRAQPFGMRVLYTQRRRVGAALERTLAAEYRQLPALLAESDVVSLHVPLTADTRTMIDAAALRRMRRGAILVNTSRGGLIDEAAMIAALRDGHLGGAGLDVRAEEPPRDAVGLAEVPTVVLTPHVAAGTGDDLLRDVVEVLANVARVRRGESPAELATPE